MSENIDIPEDCSIVLPTVELRVIYGLADDGTPIIYQRWRGSDGNDVDFLTKAGLTGFLQQCTTADFIESASDDDDD